MHRLLEQEHTAAVWLRVRGTLGPKKMRVIGFQVVLESKPQPTALLAALLTLLTLIALFILLITLLTVLALFPIITLLVPLAPHLITELALAGLHKHRLTPTNPLRSQ